MAASTAGILAWFGGCGLEPLLQLVVTIGTVVAVGLFMIRRLKPPEPDLTPNIHIDSEGLRWHDGDDIGEIPRESMTGFRISIDEELEFASPMVTFSLLGDWESQPLALHEPATPSKLRRFLVDDLDLPELNYSPEEQQQVIRRAVTAGLVDCEDSILMRFAARWMRANLTEPKKIEDDRWSIAIIDKIGEVIFDSAECTYTLSGKQVESETYFRLPDLIEKITDESPTDDARNQITAEVDQFIEQLEKEKFISDVESAGFLSECFDQDSSWLFEGTREGLLQLPTALDLAAEEMRTPPNYARPPKRVLGGTSMGVTIEKANWSYLGSRRITGTTERLKLLARQMREKIENAAVGAKVFYEPPHDASGRWRIRFLVREKEFSAVARLR